MGSTHHNIFDDKSDEENSVFDFSVMKESSAHYHYRFNRALITGKIMENRQKNHKDEINAG